MWGVLDDLWHSCKLSSWIMWMVAGWSGLHVQPHRWNRSPNHAEGLCDSRVACQPCSPNVPGIYEVGHEYVSLGDWGVQLSSAVRTVLRLSLLFWVILSLCCLSIALCSCVACGPYLEGCIFWLPAIWCYIPFPDWWERLSPVQSLLGPFSQLPFCQCPHCGYIPCLPLSQTSSPNTNQVTGDMGSFLCFVTCRCDADLLC